MVVPVSGHVAGFTSFSELHCINAFPHACVVNELLGPEQKLSHLQQRWGTYQDDDAGHGQGYGHDAPADIHVMAMLPCTAHEHDRHQYHHADVAAVFGRTCTSVHVVPRHVMSSLKKKRSQSKKHVFAKKNKSVHVRRTTTSSTSASGLPSRLGARGP